MESIPLLDLFHFTVGCLVTNRFRYTVSQEVTEKSFRDVDITEFLYFALNLTFNFASPFFLFSSQ